MRATRSTLLPMILALAGCNASADEMPQAADDNAPPDCRALETRPANGRGQEPAFPGQTRAPYHKTVDVVVTTVAEGLDVPWAVEQLPSGRFLVTEKAGRLRIINKDGSTLHTITAREPSARSPTAVHGERSARLRRGISACPSSG